MEPHTRHTRTAALALGVVLTTSACGQASSPSGSATQASTQAPGGTPVASSAPTRSAAVGGVRLEASMAPDARSTGAGTGGTAAGIAASPGLAVDYRLTNTGSTAVLAYDVVPQDLGSGALPANVDRQHAWVYEQSGVLRLSKQGFAPAPNVRFVAPPVMGGHVLAPGASVTGRAYAVWPPTLDVPAASFQAPRQPVDPKVRRWQLCVQVDGRTSQARPSAAGGGVVQAPAAAPQGQELVCTDPTAIPVS